jgi:predicted flavoprotein YhiN
MARYWNDKTEEETVGDDLEPYRRLVELQKQMIDLAQQHELTKRRRDALREQMVREVVDRQAIRRGLRQRLRQSAAKLLQCVPRLMPAKPDLSAINNKSSSLC